ncbi:MAG: bifunctional folylpolyglutamate synthase/dihydrofolate synthase [Oscillospiraceae bacterium]|nr:bifunctional folylpolyglutamate synthase/dihydrofolate synthase [Oscillospiraceae bacterium]
MTRYDAALARLHARPKSTAVPTLTRITSLLQALGNPQQMCRCIHITGTNGKGSTAAYTAAALRCAGFRTGLFTSPYLVDFRERFQQDGKPISKSDFLRLQAKVHRAENALSLFPINEFEFVTAVAFCWFAETKCDYVVLEAGMGGLYDPTNVISSAACTCITQVSLDHTALLGKTVSEIARNKAGIIKPGVPLVTPCTQAANVLTVFQQTCSEKAAPLIVTQTPDACCCGMTRSTMRYDNLDVTVPLVGRHQLDNAANAIEICHVLGLADAQIVRGIAQTIWPGRLQILQETPMILADSGHNPGGIAALCSALDTIYARKRIHAVMTMMADKDYAPCIAAIAARASRFYACTLPLPRALSPDAVAAAAQSCSDVLRFDSLRAALNAAQQAAAKDDLILVCGSVFLAGEAIKILTKC